MEKDKAVCFLFLSIHHSYSENKTQIVFHFVSSPSFTLSVSVIVPEYTIKDDLNLFLQTIEGLFATKLRSEHCSKGITFQRKKPDPGPITTTGRRPLDMANFFRSCQGGEVVIIYVSTNTFFGHNLLLTRGRLHFPLAALSVIAANIPTC
jgi:hypothetical protein